MATATPMTTSRKMALLMAELCILAALVVVSYWIVNHPGPVSVLKFPDASKYNWHAILNTFGFVGFMFNAVIVYKVVPGNHDFQKKVPINFLNPIITYHFSRCTLYCILWRFRAPPRRWFSSFNFITRMGYPTGTAHTLSSACSFMFCTRVLSWVEYQPSHFRSCLSGNYFF
jgi:hypothetical protein